VCSVKEPSGLKGRKRSSNIDGLPHEVIGLAAQAELSRVREAAPQAFPIHSLSQHNDLRWLPYAMASDPT
jgi:hypothetical protein